MPRLKWRGVNLDTHTNLALCRLLPSQCHNQKMCVRQIILRHCGDVMVWKKSVVKLCSFNTKHGPNASVPRKMDRCLLFVGHWANGRTVHFLWYTIAGSYGSGECTDTRRDVQVVEKDSEETKTWRSLVSFLVRWSRGVCINIHIHICKIPGNCK